MVGTRYIELEHAPSTNSYLQQLLSKEPKLEQGTLVRAISQSQGRGQIGNTWESEGAMNLTLSYLLRPSFLRPDIQFVLSMAISLGLAELVKAYTNKVSIKWPNDIYIGKRKVAGILIENTLRGASISSSVIGIGLNVNQISFLGDAPNPVSLAHVVGRKLVLSDVLQNLIANQSKYLEWLWQGEFDKIKQAYLSYLFRYNESADYEAQGQRFSAQIIDVEPSGRLVLKTDEGQLLGFMFKEVSFCL